MGLEPTRHECHKILSLARLPVPTLPHIPLFLYFYHKALNYTTIFREKSQVLSSQKNVKNLEKSVDILFEIR